MGKPGATELARKAGISKAYACELLGKRVPAPGLAVHIYRRTGWRHASIADLSDEQMDVLESVAPWTPRQMDAA